MSDSLNQLFDIMRILREPETGCPWSTKQTHNSLSAHVVEEAYEAAHAMGQNDDEALKSELGDLLLQVVFHARIAEERGAFTFDDIATAIADKLTRRYPTILGDEPNTLRTEDEVIARWNQVKEQERQSRPQPDKSLLDDIPTTLPALIRAVKIKDAVAAKGFDWDNLEDALAKIDEELEELRVEISHNSPRDRIADELGDVLYTVADVGRWLHIHAEDALQKTNNKFSERIRGMESGAKARGKDLADCDSDELFELYRAAKVMKKQKKAG